VQLAPLQKFASQTYLDCVIVALAWALVLPAGKSDPSQAGPFLTLNPGANRTVPRIIVLPDETRVLRFGVETAANAGNRVAATVARPTSNFELKLEVEIVAEQR
jgi:hypothetical protein